MPIRVKLSRVPRPDDSQASPEVNRVRMPIRVKITVPYLLLALLVAVGAAVVVSQIIIDKVEERFLNQLADAGRQASESMVREEDNLLASLRLVAYADGVSQAVQAADAEALRSLIYGIAVNRREGAVEVLDSNGNLLFSMRHKTGGLLEEYNFVRDGGDAMMAYDFIRQVVEQRADSIGDKFAGVARASWGDYFYVAGPVLDENGNFVGVIVVGKTLADLAQQIREETLAHISFYDSQGAPIATTLYQPMALDAALAESALARQSDESLKRDLTSSNYDYAELVGPWEMRGDVDLGLTGVALSKSFLASAGRISRIEVAILVALALLFIILLGLIVANLITKPIRSLVKASSEVASGNLHVKVEPTTDDEMAVLARTFNEMVANLSQSRADLLNSYDSTLEGWSVALELRDSVTEGHTRRVTQMTEALARRLGISGEALMQIHRGAMLHDIGKMGIPDAILNKPGPLDEREWDVMRRHPQYAYEMLNRIAFLRPALDIPYGHHEHWDGGGYPQGLSGEAIPYAARIFSVVDVWDALTSDRPYRKAMPVGEVVAYMRSQSGRMFDPAVLEVFLDIMLESAPATATATLVPAD